MSWLVGERDVGFALAFMDDVKDRLASSVQLTTGGRSSYLNTMAADVTDTLWSIDGLVAALQKASVTDFDYRLFTCNGTILHP